MPSDYAAELTGDLTKLLSELGVTVTPTDAGSPEPPSPQAKERKVSAPQAPKKPGRRHFEHDPSGPPTDR